MGELGLMKEVEKFGERREGDRVRARKGLTCCVSAVKQTENDVLSTPSTRNYNLAPRKENRSV